MDFTTAGYLANNPAFPHQTTADQFFDPDQFDAYRLLGYKSAMEMTQALELERTITSWQAVTAEYRRHSRREELARKEELDAAKAAGGRRADGRFEKRLPRLRRLRRGR